MKKQLILIFIGCIFPLSLWAQADYRDPFMGTWVWHNNTDTFRMKFKKETYNFIGRSNAFILKGYHEYKTGNKVLESSLQYYDADKEIKLSTIFTWWSPNWNEPNNILEGDIQDVEYRRYERDLALTLLPDKKTMQFEARNKEYIALLREGESSPFPKNRTFYFPKSMVLTKEAEPLPAPPPPLINPIAPTAITPYTATLQAQINAHNSPTKVYFEYGTTTAYGTQIVAMPPVVNGNNTTAVSANITGLLAHTTYQYRAYAIANGNLYYGTNVSFTTAYDKPTFGGNATNITTDAITFSGFVNPQNLGDCLVWVEYTSTATNTAPNKTFSTTKYPIKNSNTNIPFNIPISGFFNGVVYVVRIVVSQNNHGYYGPDTRCRLLPTKSEQIKEKIKQSERRIDN